MSDRAAIVTGGSRGVGRAIARALALDGYAVTITGRRSEGVERAVAELRQCSPNVYGVALNHTDAEAPRQIVTGHVRRFGRLDVLVNNAGVGIGAAAEENQTKYVSMMLDVNIRAVVLFYREAVPMLKAAAVQTGQSHVVNVASLSAVDPLPWLSAYSATKAAVVAYSEAMAKELAPHNIKSTALCPGLIDTEMADFITPQLPSEEMIQPDDLAATVRYLLALSRGCGVSRIVFMPPPRDVLADRPESTESPSTDDRAGPGLDFCSLLEPTGR